MEPQLSDQIIQTVVPVTMFCLMFGMGLTLTTADFKRILVFPKPVITGLVLQLMVLPFIGFGIAQGFELPVMLAVGLVGVAACPGGTTSNVIVHMGKGDTALSISLTALATSVTLFTLPLWVNYTLAEFGTSGTTIEMPVLRTAAQLGVFTVLPVIIGMIVRNRKPSMVEKEPIISKISTFAMVAAFIGAAVVDENNTLEEAKAVVLPCVILLFAALALGFGVPRLLKINVKDSSTIAVETCLKNILLPLFIATNSLQAIEAAYPSAVFGTIMMPVAIGIMVAYNIANKKSAALAGEQNS